MLSAPAPRGGIDVAGFYLTHFMGAVFPLTAGLLLYGWRGALTVGTVVGSAALSVTVWRRIGPRGRTLHWSHSLWLATVLAMMFPAHLATTSSPAGELLWPILPSAGLILVIFLWLFGGLGSGHVHPVLASYLLLVICFGELLSPHRVLNRDHLLTGDLFHSQTHDARVAQNQSWISRHQNAFDAEYLEAAGERLNRYTSGRETPPRNRMTLLDLLRDALPPLEDFIVAGQPGAVGASSVIAVIIGGLFLLYRGTIDYRIPLLACAAAYLGLLLLPVPAVIAAGPHWTWGAFRLPGIGWSVALTFVNYEMMASPLIFTAFFLATAPSIRPMTRRGRTIYAILIGLASAALQLYVSVAYGPYLALLAVSLLTPELDRCFSPKPLV